MKSMNELINQFRIGRKKGRNKFEIRKKKERIKLELVKRETDSE